MWPGDTVFPDFFHPKAFSYWHDLAEKFHKQIPFDGLWVVRVLLFIYSECLIILVFLSLLMKETIKLAKFYNHTRGKQ